MQTYLPVKVLKRGLANLLFGMLLLVSQSITALAQQKYTLSGQVRDLSNGEDLIGALVQVTEVPGGTATNGYGFYSLTLPQGNYHLHISYMGFGTIDTLINLDKNLALNFSMGVRVKELKEVTVRAEGGRQEVRRNQMGRIEIPIQQIKQLPVLFGEVDILKTLQLLPGVQSGSEGSTGFYVRGGGPDQNLIVLDEAIVYNASHLFGFFSVFNSDAVKNVELFKGGYPAKYGGRLSSVVDVALRDGNAKKYNLSGGIGLIASRLTLEGPIKKDTGSFIISARRTYLDIFTRAYNKTKVDDPKYNPIPDYFFYDLNAKANWKFNQNNRLYLSGYFGRDVFGFKRGTFDFGFDWGNATGTARWNHIFSPKLFGNTTATFTNYKYTLGNNGGLFQFKIGSSIEDWTIKQDFDYKAGAKHNLKFGLAGTYHIFGIGRFSYGTADTSVEKNNTLYGSDAALYAADNWDVTDRLQFNYGLRLSAFGTPDKYYVNPEPRFAAAYKLSDITSLKGSYTRMAQYIHLVSGSGASLPTDVWFPSLGSIKPQLGDQVAGGITTLLFGEKVTLTDEVYYKWMQNQVDFRNGAQLFLNDHLDEEFVRGKGWSYGNEIYIEKSEGRLTGWIGYTLSWTWRQFDSLNFGKAFRPKYDVRNDIKVVATYKLTSRLMLSGTFVYNTGTLATLPTGWEYVQDIGLASTKVIPLYDERSNYRQPAYHRMDLGLVWKLKPKRGESDLTFSIYNVYNRRNAYFIYIEQALPTNNQVLQLPSGAVAKQVALFPIIPSITWNFKF